MQKLLEQWQSARQALELLRTQKPHLPLEEFAGHETALLDRIEGLDADIWMLGHELTPTYGAAGVGRRPTPELTTLPHGHGTAPLLPMAR